MERKNMKIEPTLTNENFFRRMKELYPVSMNRFCDWIDEYKMATGWKGTIETDYRNAFCMYMDPAIKYHDLPNAMQLGIFIAFIRAEDRGQDYTVDLFAFNIQDFIEDYLKHTNE